MTPRAIIDNLVAQGCAPRLTPDGCGIVVPKGAITEALKVAIRANKPAIIRLLAEAANDAHHRPELAQGTAPTAPPQSVATVASVASSHGLKAASFPPTAPAPGPQGLDPGEQALLNIAMKFCNATHASDKEREDWQRDVLETPPHLRQGLYNYLREQLRPVNLLWRNQK